MQSKKIILASSSPYRAKALQQLGLSFSIEVPDIDESPLAGEAPSALAGRLSFEKALRLSTSNPDAIWIGSDQVMVLGNRFLGKPLEHAIAIEQLEACSGQSVQVLTGLCVLHPATQTRYEYLDHTLLRFRHLALKEIEAYLDFQKPYHCCGGVQVEGLGISLFEAIETKDPSAILGIPLIALCQFLRKISL